MHPAQDEAKPGSGVAGTLKFIGILAVLLLAVMAMLFVLDVFPREMLGDATVKALVVLGIVAVASVAIGLLARGRSN
jgi:hypothetical protein